MCRHGTHIRSQKTRDVRPLEPHGQAIHPGRQGHRYCGARRRPRPRLEPDAAPRAAECARRQHAQGQDGCGDSARLGQGCGQLLRKSFTKATRRMAWPCWSKPRPTIPPAPCASLRNIFMKGAGNMGTTGSVSFLFKKMGVFRLDPVARQRSRRARAGSDRLRSRGNGRQHRRQRRAAIGDSRRLQ